jgi:hypothetical protein
MSGYPLPAYALVLQHNWSNNNLSKKKKKKNKQNEPIKKNGVVSSLTFFFFDIDLCSALRYYIHILKMNNKISNSKENENKTRTFYGLILINSLCSLDKIKDTYFCTRNV